jgi:type II secretory pathway component GspD/PulD (secretin)
MAWSLKAADGPSSKTFFFNADEAKAADVAIGISDFYGVTVLVQESANARKISGRLLAHSLEETLEAFGFLLGTRYRADPTRSAFFFGAQEEKSFADFPSYGLTAAEAQAVFKEQSSVVGDRLIVETQPRRAAEIRDALKGLAVRPTLNLEVVMVDVATNTIDRVNAWLDTFSVGLGYVSQSANALAQTSTPAGTAAAISGSGWFRDVQLKGLFALLDTDSSASVELRQQAQILSGSQTVFSSGQVVEVPLIVREPQTGKDLVTQIERRTVGLQLRLRATALGETWQVEFDLEDGALVNSKEQTTKFTGQRRVAVDGNFLVLASFSRRSREEAKREVTGFGKIPMVGSAFRKSTAQRANRSFMILARALPERPAAVSKVPALALPTEP